jgi:SAM-dependent methyltransferase
MSVIKNVRKTLLATTPGRMLKAALQPKCRYKDILAGCALESVLDHCDFQTVLDVGSGAGKHADIFEANGKHVTAIDFGVSVYFQQKSSHRTDIIADYYQYPFETPFDCVWASHVLEHQPNPNDFLRKTHRDLREGGWLAITVPPLKHKIVGGHLTLWNAGLLLYQLVFAGFDCRHAAVRTYGYNVSVIVKKATIKEMPALHYDSGDIDRLSQFFPAGLKEGFNGRIKQLNWPTNLRK